MIALVTNQVLDIELDLAYSQVHHREMFYMGCHC